jgi:UDPglucose 6-dehydrogenase
VVASAIGLDTRIGRKYLRGALGYGGPCFPRDNTAFSRFAKQHGVDATLADATDQVNKRQAARLAERILDVLPEGGSVGILGLSYKPDTEVIEESQGIMLAQYLLAEGRRVVVYDPVAMDNARRVLDAAAIFASSIEACAAEAAVLAIATPWNQFKALRAEHLNRSCRPVIMDWWQILRPADFEASADYVSCGRGPAAGAAKPETSAKAVYS